MSKFSLKAGANRFLLDDEHVYYAIFVKEEERDFIAERGKNKGKRFTGLNFYYEIISNRKLLEGEGSSRGKQLRIFFFANGMEGDRFVFPKKGEYFAVFSFFVQVGGSLCFLTRNSNTPTFPQSSAQISPAHSKTSGLSIFAWMGLMRNARLTFL